MKRLVPALAASCCLLAAFAAHAQVGGSGMGAPGAPMGEDQEKSDGVAEKAPSEEGQQPTTPVLPPWPGYETKKLSLFTVDGYFRFRTDWFSKLNLGFHDRGAGAPFAEALSCREVEGTDGGQVDVDACDDTLSTANMRLRVEPRIHLSEDVVVRSQIDMLDNLVLGATPQGATGQAPGVLDGNQAPPEQGRNYAYDSIRVKRAWAEIQTPLGLLKLGRMPSHWGMGMMENSGDYNQYTGVYCTDCDSGDTVDRVSFERGIPGTNLQVMIAKDWPGTGPTDAEERPYGQPMDLDNADDVKQWVFIVGHLDDATSWKEKTAAGELVLNYGAYVIKRDQDWASFLDMAGNTDFIRREAHLWIPDVFVRLAWGPVRWSVEAAMGLGDIEDASDVGPGLEDQEILTFGAVTDLAVSLLDDDLELGLEVGYASGDQYDANPQGELSIDNSTLVPSVEGDDTLRAFIFDRNYHVDLILFRELLGAVHNATYFKPHLGYDITDRFGFDVAAIVSMANKKVATPGNSRFFGVELNGDLGYRNEDEGFFAGLSYGVLFPMGALDHPAELFPMGEQGEAGTAQTFQMRALVTF